MSPILFVLFRLLIGVAFSQNLAEIRKAAEQGDARAQFNLAAMYANGQGVPKDHREAAKWCRLAAEQGNASAQHYRGLMYVQGEGVPQDCVQAYMWINLASIDGATDAGKLRKDWSNVMTADQIAEAQRLPQEWKPKSSETGS